MRMSDSAAADLGTRAAQEVGEVAEGPHRPLALDGAEQPRGHPVQVAQAHADRSAVALDGVARIATR